MLGDVIKMLKGGSKVTAAPRITVPKTHQKAVPPFSSSASPFTTSSGAPAMSKAEKGRSRSAAAVVVVVVVFAVVFASFAKA